MARKGRGRRGTAEPAGAGERGKARRVRRRAQRQRCSMARRRCADRHRRHGERGRRVQGRSLDASRVRPREDRVARAFWVGPKGETRENERGEGDWAKPKRFEN